MDGWIDQLPMGYGQIYTHELKEVNSSIAIDNFQSLFYFFNMPF